MRKRTFAAEIKAALPAARRQLLNSGADPTAYDFGIDLGVPEVGGDLTEEQTRQVDRLAIRNYCVGVIVGASAPYLLPASARTRRGR